MFTSWKGVLHFNIYEETIVAKKKTSKKKPGLYANIHKAQEREKRGGRKVRSKNESGAPSDEAFTKSEKTAKRK